MSDEPIDHAKRATVAGGLAALLTACGPTPVSQRTESRNQSHEMIEPLRRSGLAFTDHNGNRINLDDLERRLKNGPSTLSFQFASCGDICPLTGQNLGEIVRQPNYRNVTNVVISTLPFDDQHFMVPRLMYGYDAIRMPDDTTPPNETGLTVSRDGGVSDRSANTIALFPHLVDASGRMIETTFDNKAELEARIGEIQSSGFDLPVGNPPGIGHTGTLQVYDAQGHKRGQVDNPGRIPSELPSILDDVIARGQSR